MLSGLTSSLRVLRSYLSLQDSIEGSNSEDSKNESNMIAFPGQVVTPSISQSGLSQNSSVKERLVMLDLKSDAL